MLRFTFFFSIFLTGINCGWSQALSLPRAVDLAVQYAPSLRAAQAQAAAAEQDISAVRQTAVPDISIAYQLNLATYNNITGMAWPQTFPPISGPPSPGNDYAPVPGSALALNFTWAPTTFGRRNAAAGMQEEHHNGAVARVADETLRLQAAVSLLFLDALENRELAGVYRQNIERLEFSRRQAGVLARNGLRPGVDSLRFAGELAAGRAELQRVESLYRQQLIRLAHITGQDGVQFTLEESALATRLPDPVPAETTTAHPLRLALESTLAAEEWRRRELGRAWAPRLNLWGSLYARGSGISYDNELDFASGFGFSRYNYGFGVQATFPLLDYGRVGIDRKRQEAVIAAAAENLNQLDLELQTRRAAAREELAGALAVAREIPSQYEAAAEAYRALRTRYEAGLVDYLDFVQAQYQLLQAEAALRTASLHGWQALLQVALAEGNLTLFLNQIPN